MSSPGSPLLEIERSVRTQSVVVWGVLTTLAVVPYGLSALPLGVTAALSISLPAIAALGFWRIGWLLEQRAVRRASWTSEGQWHLTDLRGRSWPATLDPSSRVMGRLLWLRFDDKHGLRELLLIGSDLPPIVRRRLLARLRLQAGALSLARPADKGDLPL